jgi:VanZ family protein
MMYYFSSQPGLEALPLLEKLQLLPDINLRDLDKDLETIARKAGHIIEYAMLYILVHVVSGRLFFRKGEKKTAQTVFFSLLFCFFFALSDEYHQLFVEDRSGRILDICVDIFGVFLGQLLTLLVMLLWPKKKDPFFLK